MKLFIADPSGAYLPAPDADIFAVAAKRAAHKLSRPIKFDAPSRAGTYLVSLLATRDAEAFCVAYLDNRHRLIAFVEHFQGTIDGCSVHPREIVRAALAHNAAALVLVHNHPSGVAEPSRADELITTRLKEALALVDIRMVDHFIIAGGECLSMAERGLV